MGCNAEQQKVVDSTHDRILVLAGAGAGKTYVMLERIKHLIDSGVNPESILALTFTNAAGANMKQRFIATAKDKVNVPQFRTFHSFCYLLICKDPLIRSSLGYNNIPSICTSYQYKNLQKEVKLELGTKLSDEVIEGKRKPSGEKEKFEYELFTKALKKKLKANNQITFDMLCYDTADLFNRNEVCTHKYKKQYTYIFVDEFQDTDARQVKFLESFQDSQFVLVGDALQSIYQFRQCTNEFVKAFSKSDGWQVIKMPTNYRSTKQICEFANKFSKKYADDNYRIEMQGTRSGDTVECFHGFSSSYDEPVSKSCLRSIAGKINTSPEPSAVLCRTNREAEAVKQYLLNQGIDCNAVDYKEVVCPILRSVFDDAYMLDWLSSLLPSEKHAEYLRMSYANKDADVRWFAKVYGADKSLNRYGKQIVAIRKFCRESKDNEAIITKIGEILNIPNAFNEFENWSNELDHPTLMKNIVEHLENINQPASTYVGTIHSSKGLEYDRVFVVGVNNKMFELGTEEMNNLFYVAVTRAKNHLVIYSA